MVFMVFYQPPNYPYNDLFQNVYSKEKTLAKYLMSESIVVLVVDDDIAQAEMVSEFLRISGFHDVFRVASIQKLWEFLKKQTCDIILLDYKLPDGTGLDVLERMSEQDIQIPVVMVTGQGNERVAAQAIQRGATDYMLKSGGYLVTLPSVIRKTLRSHQLKLDMQRSLEQVRYQALLINNVRDAIVVWDMLGNITYWNPAASALFGWSAEERLGQPVTQVYLSAFTPPVIPPRERDPLSHHVVRKYINRDGKTVWISSRVSSLRADDQPERLIGFMDVSHDITRRVETEQALRESEARYRAIVEDYQTELICRYKPNGTLSFVNEVFCRYFGRTRRELLGMNFLYFIPEKERAKMVQHLLTFGPQKPVATIEHQVELPNQGLRWLQRTDRVIFDDNERIFEFQSVGHDITARKNMEAEIQAAQAYLIQAARMATIGEMASGIAHQIYNPLTTIIADTQILLRKLPNDQTIRDSAEAIEQAGWRLQQVVQRLMEFSRPTSDSLSELSINETIQNAISLLNPRIESSGCNLEAHLSDELPSIRGNERQLESLWVNLLLLACDAVADGRGNLIRVRSEAGSSNTVVVEVCDNGKPIPATQLASIFEPNFITASSGRGTGIEPSICREIVRQHGGQISVESTPDRDTIFRVSLPIEA